MTRWVSGIALLGLTSCATIQSALSFKAPDISLTDITVTGLGLTGGTLDLAFDVYNPNTYRVRSTRMELGLDLEGVHFGNALLERPLDLSPENHSRVIVPVRFEWAGVGAGARAFFQRQEIKYGIDGAVLLDTPIGEQRVGLRASGDVPLRKLF
jgi:LEA14-like dessication related protein